ncbi:DUF2851 family protein [Porphyromonas sp. COT-239 OH1446]|uniref:DUF2851 family protein n=1 Tax=Porphyromonas sp. COT-239 OH1446 TaxID=1515613 RepID=UPI00052CB303|nr:DUF2851 family protein [Porphyromonas sp. COT-239 OH1446]KGN67197.1 hypothetical protein HQ37_08215 [Porphyromonas sp. COT-239 OH1446]
METFLHYLWASRQYTSLDLVGEAAPATIEVIDPGTHNVHAGPDFFNAKVKINNILWVGDVEVHRSAGQWFEHGHHRDPLYRSVILHVVEYADTSTTDQGGRRLPTCVIGVPEELRERAEYLVASSSLLPCSPLLGRVSEHSIREWLHSLALERMERRVEQIAELYQSYSDPREVGYLLLMRYFGFSLNNDTMEALARSLPYRVVEAEQDRLVALEAALLGQAGLLDEVLDDDRRRQLVREYARLRQDYGLRPIDARRWLRAKIRPANQPLSRLLQLASIFHLHRDLAQECLYIRDIDQLSRLLSLHKPSRRGSSSDQESSPSLRLGKQSLSMLFINVIVPYQIEYARRTGQVPSFEVARHSLEELPPESNRHTRLFDQEGIHAANALGSQGMIELRTSYCLPRKCLFCRWGRELLSARSSKDKRG